MIYPDGKRKYGQWFGGKIVSYTDEEVFQIFPEGWV